MNASDSSTTFSPGKALADANPLPAPVPRNPPRTRKLTSPSQRALQKETVADPPAAAAVDDAAATKRPFQLQRLLTGTPSWLVSLTVHLLLMILLALMTIAPQAESAATIIAALTASDESPLVEALEFMPQKLEALQPVSTAVAAADLSMANVGDLGDAIPSAELSANDLDVPAGGEIGEIFSGGGGLQSPAGSETQGAQFFGVKATGRRFVFIVDSSNSMRKGKFDAAKEELSVAIRRLRKDQFFYVIFFDHDAARMTFAPNEDPEEFTVPATYENIEKFEKWMATVENELRTDPYDAMAFAVKMSPDAIYILSDGKFTDRGQTVRYLAAENIIDDPVTGRIPRVVVHTVAFWQNDGEEQMKSIAKDYGGTYRFVPAPKDAKKLKK